MSCRGKFPFETDEQCYDRALRETLEHGAKAVKRGEYGALEMSCFNRAEVEIGKAYMASQHPDIPVRWAWTAPLPGGVEITGLKR